MPGKKRHDDPDDLWSTIFNPVPRWARQMFERLLQIEYLVRTGHLPGDKTHLSKEDQVKVDEIHRIATSITKRVDDALKTGPAVPGKKK